MNVAARKSHVLGEVNSVTTKSNNCSFFNFKETFSEKKILTSLNLSGTSQG